MAPPRRPRALRAVRRSAGSFVLASALSLAAVLSPAAARPATAQQVPAAGADQAASPPPLGVSPRGAFIRAMLVPGWGHAAIGSYTRGGFYFALESLTAYTLIRTRIRLGDARERAGLRESFVRAELAREGLTDPAEVQARLDEDERLQSYRALIESREGQQEDLIAFGIFLVFLTGADAYVSAHLSRFPAPIDIEASVADGGRTELAVRVALPR